MPLYEYQCEKCGDLFEVRQKFSDEPLTSHEKCGGKVHRLISVPALQFKGSGFYITDYAKGTGAGSKNGDSSSNASSSESGGTSSSEGKSSSASETKPAASSSSSEKKSD